ncbi:hypothetical protein [Nonomuraea dietziae]
MSFLNNTFAVEKDGRLSTIYGGTSENPKAVMPPTRQGRTGTGR